MRIKFIELFLAVLCVIALVNAAYAKTYTAKDIERLKAFADAGDPDAIATLAVAYFDGNGVKKSRLKTEEYYRKGIKLGDTGAMACLGGILFDQKKYAEGIKYIKISAKSGYPYAYINLGIAYDDGLGVPKNPALAEKYYKLAAEAGIPLGQFDLAYFYEHVLKNAEKAFFWYKKSVLSGFFNAYPKIAAFYIVGIVVDKDLSKAYMYAKYGKMLNAQGSKKTLDIYILPEINPAEKAEGEKLLKDYIAKHPINND